jgi:putative polyhydroxyalkanoate system protein
MAQIDIAHPHTMGREKARKAVGAIADDLRNRLQVDYHWEGDELLFNRPGATGRIDVDDENVRVRIDLGMFLAPMKGVVESQIRNYLDQHLS